MSGETGTIETHEFQAETGKLLDLMINSLYSDKEIFLRELISNASDACDKLRYAAIAAPDLLAGDPELAVTITVDRKKRLVTVADNGVGMDRDEVIDNLGSIARSGTEAFVAGLSAGEAAGTGPIGKFGVGFYSAFMVADRVTVTAAKAGEEEAWRWRSDGTAAYTVEAVARGGRGTSVELRIRRGLDEFLDTERLRAIVKTWSDHIALPIRLAPAGEEAETVNVASALWTRPKKDIEATQYTEFYRHNAHAFDEPWLTLHNKAEGRIEYTSLLFVPSAAPFDLFHPERKHGVKLYVRRVFIADDCEGLMPRWLRFVRGIVDSEDLPLNISRETLQRNPVLERIRIALVKRVLGALERKADKEAESYAEFWENFGAVLKEGIYEDRDYRDRLLKLLRAKSTRGDGLVGLADYVSRMKEGQDSIYTMTGEDAGALRASPQIEGFAARGVEVLLFDDAVDDFWLGAVSEFDGRPFRSVTRGDIDLTAIKGAGEDGGEEKETPPPAGAGALVAAFREALEDKVKDVRASSRLTDSAVCLVADEGGLDMHLERMLKQHRRLDSASRKILEINPSNPLIAALAARAEASPSDPALAEAAALLLDQARIVESEPLPDPAAFARRMTETMARALGA